MNQNLLKVQMDTMNLSLSPVRLKTNHEKCPPLSLSASASKRKNVHSNSNYDEFMNNNYQVNYSKWCHQKNQIPFPSIISYDSECERYHDSILLIFYYFFYSFVYIIEETLERIVHNKYLTGQMIQEKMNFIIKI